ncbi:MAG: ATP-binding protein [bacterium]
MNIMDIHHSNYYLLVTSATLLLAFFVLFRNPKKKVNQIFFLLELCISVWGLEYAVLSLIPKENEILALNCLIIPKIGIPFIYSTFFHFSLIITKSKRNIHWNICKIGYIFSFIQMLLSFVPEKGFIVKGVIHTQYGFYPVAGEWYFFNIFNLLFFLCYGILLLFRKWWVTKDRIEKRRLLYLWMGVIIAFVGGSANTVVAYNPTHALAMRFPLIYPLGHIIVFLSTLFISYGIFKYRLMDIIVRKGVIYFPFLFIFIILILGIGKLFVIPPGFGLILTIISTALIVGSITLIFQVREKPTTFLNKYLFPGRYALEQIITEFEEELTLIFDKEVLISKTMNTIKKIIPNVTEVFIMLLDEEMKEYKVSAATIGMDENERRTIIFKSDEFIIKWFKEEKRELFKDRLKKYSRSKEVQERLKNVLEKVNIILLFPLIYRDKLVGLLGVRRKVEDDECYTDEDLEFLSKLCKEVALCLENIKLNELQEKIYGVEEEKERITTLYMINSWIQKEEDIDKIFYLILTGVTFGKGLGFNRAVLLLLDEKQKCLKGKMGIGPTTEEEAIKIWKSIEKMTIEDCIAQCEISNIWNTSMNEIVRTISIPVTKEEPGILTLSVLEKKSFNIKDINDYPEIQRFLKELDPPKTLAIVPLIFKEKIIGVIIADNKYNKKPITNLEMEIFSLFADQASFAAAHQSAMGQYLFIQMKKRVDQLEMISKISNELNTIREMKQLLQSVVDTVADTLKGRICTLFLYNCENKKLTLGAVYPKGWLPPDAEYGLGERLTGSVALSEKPVIIRNTKADTRHIGGVGKYHDYLVKQNESIKEIEIKTFLGVSIKKNGKLLGVLTVTRERESEYDDKSFTEDDAIVIKTLAEQIGIVLENTRLLDELLSDLSHRLLNPLSIIKQSTQLLQQGIVSDVKEQEDYFKEIVKESDYSINLIKNLLDIKVIEGVKDIINKVPLQLRKLIEDVITHYNLPAQQKGIKFDISGISEDLPSIMGDKEWVSKVLENLLSNALNYSNKGTITISAEEKDDWICISVSDEGIGIPPNDLSHIFEKFYRGGNAKFVEGAGIGLTFTKSIVEAHGGQISVTKSEVGKGSTFEFTLPIIQTDKQ